MHFANPYWSEKTKADLLEKWILIHSIIYYHHDTSLVSDKMFDDNGKQLVQLMKTHPEAFRKSKWYYCFKTFDGCTGFDLYTKLRKPDKIELTHIAEHLIRQFGNKK